MCRMAPSVAGNVSLQVLPAVIIRWKRTGPCSTQVMYVFSLRVMCINTNGFGRWGGNERQTSRNGYSSISVHDAAETGFKLYIYHYGLIRLAPSRERILA